jgi:hypothetical protein
MKRSGAAAEVGNWIVKDRTLELETLAALYRALLAQQRFHVPEALAAVPFSFETWLLGLVEQIRGDLGAVAVGFGFFDRPGAKLRKIYVVRRGESSEVAGEFDFLTLGPEPTRSELFRRVLRVEAGAGDATSTWGSTAGEAPERRNIALLAELPLGEPERQKRVVEAATVAAWVMLRDTLFEFIQPGLWARAGVDPSRLFKTGTKKAAYVFADIRGFTTVADMLARYGGDRGGGLGPDRGCPHKRVRGKDAGGDPRLWADR